MKNNSFCRVIKKSWYVDSMIPTMNGRDLVEFHLLDDGTIYFLYFDNSVLLGDNGINRLVMSIAEFEKEFEIKIGDLL